MNKFLVSFICVIFSCLVSAQSLDKTYGNKFFTMNYPSNWEILQEDSRVTSNINITVQVIEKRVNEWDFCPSVNIIKSPQKRTETTASLAARTLKQIRSVLPQVESLGSKSVRLSGCNGTMLEYKGSYNGYSLHWLQYIIKKSDNTTYTITCTLDNNKFQSQKKIAEAIVNSIVIK